MNTFGGAPHPSKSSFLVSQVRHLKGAFEPECMHLNWWSLAIHKLKNNSSLHDVEEQESIYREKFAYVFRDSKKKVACANRLEKQYEEHPEGKWSNDCVMTCILERKD